MKLTQILTLVAITAGLAFMASCKTKQPPPPPAQHSYSSGK